MAGDLDHPYQHLAHAVVADGNAMIAGGLVVAAATIPVPAPDGNGEVVWPALVFQFAAADGSGMGQVVLVLDDDHMAKTRPLIMAAIADARRAASIATPARVAEQVDQPPAAT